MAGSGGKLNFMVPRLDQKKSTDPLNKSNTQRFITKSNYSAFTVNDFDPDFNNGRDQRNITKSTHAPAKFLNIPNSNIQPNIHKSATAKYPDATENSHGNIEDIVRRASSVCSPGFGVD